MNYIPDGLAADTLRRLPVSSVVRFGCVCKSWYSLIRNPDFMLTHFQNTQLQQHMVHKYRESSYDNTSLSFYTGDYLWSHTQEIKLPGHNFTVAGSCNGILCLFYSDGKHIKYTLHNPSIRHSFCLPSRQYKRDQSVGFGFDADSKDYKIIQLYIFSAEIYSFKLNCWRNISVPEITLFHNKVGAFVNGCLHWVVEIDCSENVVLVFDVKAETFGQFSLPLGFADIIAYGGMDVFGYGGNSIAVTKQPLFCETEIVVMKEYGVTESWEHLATLGEEGGEFPYVLGFRDKDRVISRLGSSLDSQKLSGSVDEDLMSVSELDDFSVHRYVPSLFLLDKQNNACDFGV